MLDYAAWLLFEFIKYEAIAILETLQNTGMLRPPVVPNSKWKGRVPIQVYGSSRKAGNGDEQKGPMLWIVLLWAK